ncbi:MAG: hypothetical protein OXC11_00820 [Rhodospirillales bacterium]|nr:hypothetical protein [Rhodospirillales bacterium]
MTLLTVWVGGSLFGMGLGFLVLAGVVNAFSMLDRRFYTEVYLTAAAAVIPVGFALWTMP